MYFFCSYNWTVNLGEASSKQCKTQINVRNFTWSESKSRKERDLLIVHVDVHKSKKKLPSSKTMHNH